MNIKVKTLILIIVLTGFVAPVFAQDVTYTEPASIENAHKVHPKIDATGGIQRGAGLNMTLDLDFGVANSVISISKGDLNPYRGPDVMNSCAYYSSSFITGTDNTDTQIMCCLVQKILNGEKNPNPLDCVVIKSCTPEQLALGCSWVDNACSCPVNDCTKEEKDSGLGCKWDTDDKICKCACTQEQIDQGYHVQGDQCVFCDPDKNQYWDGTQCATCPQDTEWDEQQQKCVQTGPCAGVINKVTGDPAVEDTMDDRNDPCNRQYGMHGTQDCVDASFGCINIGWNSDHTACETGGAKYQHVCPSNGLYAMTWCGSVSVQTCTQYQSTVRMYRPFNCTPNPPCE